MEFRFDYVTDPSFPALKEKLFTVLESYADLLPDDKNAMILLKPNLNSNMNALTGNTTDLRLIAAVILFLQGRGYTNIVIGEGTNSGFYRYNISVISRLGVDRLAERLGVRMQDFNYSEPVEIDFANNEKAGVARECFDADFLINMPKIKTHSEAWMSVCLKNLVGCLVGQENKKKTHQALAANILNITEKVRPGLHIVDGIFSMEGVGPTKGTPVRGNLVLVGTDPYLIDLLAARYARLDPNKVITLVEAEKRGFITAQHHEWVASRPRLEHSVPFAQPIPGPLARFIHNPKRQKYFLAIRNTPLFSYLCSTKLMGQLLCLTGLRQDVFIEEDMEDVTLSLNEAECEQCGRCRDYCPVNLQLPEALSAREDMESCVGCLYCFCVCPRHAIVHQGKLGFMEEQLRQYDEIVRRIA